MKSTTRLAAMFAVVLAISAFATGALGGPEDKFPKFEEVTKDMKVVDGFFTLYHDEESDKLLARIPASMLKVPFLFATSISKGPFFAGWQSGDSAVYFEKIDTQLALVGVDPRIKKDVNGPVSDVIRRTYTDPIITATRIVTMAGSDPVIKLDDLLKSDLSGAGMIFGGSVDGRLSRYGEIRNYPQNVLIPVDLVVRRGQGGQKAGIYYSISTLPQNNGYTPREADPRVGYFLTVVKDWTTPHTEDTTFKRYINRWHLRKVMPSESVSDVMPEDQIVFYIENTVPVRFRHYVREGILEWNRAFEKAGLRNAVVVHQQTDTKYADIDPEDVRYNFFRWIVSGTPFAMGPSRVNPFTGQILDADIIMDDSYVRFFNAQYDVLGPKPVTGHTDKPFEMLMAMYPDYAPRSTSPCALVQETKGDPTQAFFDHLDHTWGHKNNRCRCEIARGGQMHLAMAGMLSMRNTGLPLNERFVGQAIKETVMHEVGHTLGLRHNFKASSWRSLEEIQSIKADEYKPLVASVMDYNPYNYAAVEDQQGHFATPTLGPYDDWAIEYGYRQFNSADWGEGGPKDEQTMLAHIASRSVEDGLAYATDEDTSFFYPDPYVNRWDKGDDPVAFALNQLETVQRLFEDGLDWAVEDGESYSKARRVFNQLIGAQSFGGIVAARVVGGQDISRDFKGDENARSPVRVLDAKMQRAALSYLGENVFSDDVYRFTPDLLNNLAAGRWSHWGSDDYDGRLSFDIHDRILGIQSIVLTVVMNPITVGRIYDAELKVPTSEDAFTVAELFESLTGMIWSELDAGAKDNYTVREPMISSFRRQLQREYLQRLINITLAKPGFRLKADAQAVVRIKLDELGEKIEKKLDKHSQDLDVYSRSHLSDVQRRIEAALDAEFVARN